MNLEDDEVNAKILDVLKGKTIEKEDTAIRELEQQGKLQKDSPKGGQEYENEEPRQG